MKKMKLFTTLAWQKPEQRHFNGRMNNLYLLVTQGVAAFIKESLSIDENMFLKSNHLPIEIEKIEPYFSN